MIELPGSHDPTVSELAVFTGATPAMVRSGADHIATHPLVSGRIVREHVRPLLSYMAGQGWILPESPARQRSRDDEPYASPRRFPA